MYIQMYGCQMYGCVDYGYGRFQELCTSPKAMPRASVFYFVSFVLLGTMIFLNLFIGIIVNSMDGMRRIRKEESQPKTSYLSELNALEEQIAALQEGIKRLRQASSTGAHSDMHTVTAAGACTAANNTLKETT
jgi:voltage-gated sodium channel